MAAVSGLLTLSGAQTNDLVGEFQESIFVRNTKGMNVGTTLFGLMARLANENADNIEFNWWERDPVKKQIYVNNGGGYTAGDTSIVVDDGSGNAIWQVIAAGHILFVERTGEYLRVTADPSSATLTVARAYKDSGQTWTGGIGAGTAAALVDNDVLTIVTLAKEEGTSAIRAAYEEPSLYTNYIQTFGSTVNLTNAFKGSVLRTDIDGPLKDRRIQALEKVGRDIEFAYLLGPRNRVAGSTGYIYTTGGIYPALMAAGLTDNIKDGGGASGVTLEAFNTWLASFMTYGSDAKLAFCGPQAFAAVSNFCSSATNGYRIMQNENVFGMNITTIMTPYGELSLTFHPLFKEATSLNDWMVAVDLAHLVQKVFEPLFLEPNIQDNGSDTYKEQYRGKLGLKLKFPNAFGVAHNLRKITLA
jgi:hypothetical protein